MYLIIFFFASMKIMYKDALYVCVCDLTFVMMGINITH